MKILLVGENLRGTVLELMQKNLIELGNEVELINTNLFFKTSFLNRIINKLLKTPHYFGAGIYKLNRFVYERGSTGGFEYILFLKPILIFPETILKLKKYSKIVGLYMDHVDFPKTGSDYFYESIPLFDLYGSAIRSNVDAMLKFGAKRSIYFPITADPTYCHPLPVSPEERKQIGADVIFVGNYANERRAEYLEKLCADGYNVHVYGDGWQMLPAHSCLWKQNRISGQALCEAMAKVMCASKIVLAFMRTRNDEKVGCRTYEIPLCGGFMLHERNQEAEALLVAGREADFFDTYEELKTKINFYLEHSELREKIAKAGHERIAHCGELIRDQMEKLPELLRAELG